MNLYDLSFQAIFFLCFFAQIPKIFCEYELEDKPEPYFVTGTECKLESGDLGKCTIITDCPTILMDFVSLKPKKSHICRFVGLNPVVCCPILNETENTNTPQTEQISEQTTEILLEEKTSVVDERISKRKCKEYIEAYGKFKFGAPVIVGGTKVLPKEFPHMAALGYGDENNIAWQCGGSLISDLYILTAAHCLFTRNGGIVQWVRLGDIDLFDTTDEGDPQNFEIISSIAHPDYQPPSSYNDIALLKLNQSARFSDYVKPACLPISDPQNVFVNFEATGWGRVQTFGDPSPHLLKVSLEIFPYDECNLTYAGVISQRRLKFGIVNDTQLCAGGRNSERDTCQGDSGGPLHQKHSGDKLFDIVGVTSFGQACGALNVPGIFTRVAYYIPWIEKIVWPDQ